MKLKETMSFFIADYLGHRLVGRSWDNREDAERFMLRLEMATPRTHKWEVFAEVSWAVEGA